MVDLITLSNSELTRFFFAIALLLASAHLFGHLFQRWRMPRVVGEIFGGLLLGPSVLGYLAPGFFQSIFLTEGKLLALIYWLGLALLMFTSGFEVQSRFNKKDRKLITALIIGSTIIPFLFGWWVTSFFATELLIGTANNVLALKLIVSVAMAVTSIPVISKMFLDMGVMHTRFAKVVLGAATLHDVLLWVFVTLATTLVTATAFSLKTIVTHIGITLLFFGFALILVPWVIRTFSYLKRYIPPKFEMSFILIVLLMFVVIASYFEINVIFGALLAGIVIGYVKNKEFEKAKSSIKDFSLAFFVPLYFAIVGIKLDLIHHFNLLFFLGFFLFATSVQLVSIIATTRLLKHSWLSSFNLAMAMNERGGPGIVLATLAFELGIISELFFVTLVLNAILTSLLGGVWFRYVLSKGWELLPEDKKKSLK